MCINLYSVEAVLFQLLSIKNAFDFAFRIEIKIEIECFLIGICKFLPVSVTQSLSVSFSLFLFYFTLSVTLAFPIAFPLPLPLGVGLFVTCRLFCVCFSLSGNIKWKTQAVNFVYNLSCAIISQNYLFVTRADI